MRRLFVKAVTHWKSVEAVYIAGHFDEDLADNARLIDFFHRGNENVHEQVKRALKSSLAPKKALFKNSTKSINALEFMLYTKAKFDHRERQFLYHMVDSLSNHLEAISDFYVQQ